jgi:hypothetical protein
VALLQCDLHKVRTFKADDDDSDDDDDGDGDDDDDDNDYNSGNCPLHSVFIIPPANYNPTS